MLSEIQLLMAENILDFLISRDRIFDINFFLDQIISNIFSYQTIEFLKSEYHYRYQKICWIF